MILPFGELVRNNWLIGSEAAYLGVLIAAIFVVLDPLHKPRIPPKQPRRQVRNPQMHDNLVHALNFGGSDVLREVGGGGAGVGLGVDEFGYGRVGAVPDAGDTIGFCKYGAQAVELAAPEVPGVDYLDLREEIAAQAI